jgi:hypothetical protein
MASVSEYPTNCTTCGAEFEGSPSDDHEWIDDVDGEWFYSGTWLKCPACQDSESLLRRRRHVGGGSVTSDDQRVTLVVFESLAQEGALLESTFPAGSTPASVAAALRAAAGLIEERGFEFDKDEHRDS